MPSDKEDLIYDDDDNWKFEDEDDGTIIVSSYKCALILCFCLKFKRIMVPSNRHTIGCITPLAWIH